MPRKPKEEKIVFDWMRGASERSKASWAARWEKAFYEGEKLGPKGEAYIEKKFGPVIGGGGGMLPEDQWPDVADFEDEYGDY